MSSRRCSTGRAGFTALVGGPGLREVVRAAFQEARHWADARPHELLIPQGDSQASSTAT